MIQDSESNQVTDLSPKIFLDVHCNSISNLVTDAGLRERVFENFVQGDASTTRT